MGACGVMPGFAFCWGRGLEPLPGPRAPCRGVRLASSASAAWPEARGAGRCPGPPAVILALVKPSHIFFYTCSKFMWALGLLGRANDMQEWKEANEAHLALCYCL